MTITNENCQMLVLQPQGRLDCDSSKLLEAQFTRLMLQRGTLWVIDLAQVDFMDSSGLVALITGLKAARASNCRLVLCNLPEPVKLIVELTQLDSVFEIYESYDAVLTSTEPSVLAA
ncbi:STAS domain-containing protein [Gloeocapsopsis dulcis]|uniref:Anti-sigma factor antagonist n=1 Tax=Gloeocapsopsis dulcis AAB1 = 1H9 TaxID=1433147 RepID=A0A6N8FQN0_9CHRO|nr:STAS domain-containing protein [Gloeocapsopsis dulcis]MUL35124.1 anti-anti-sigma factor [Gloeocapsopsis dulcis AAB1 = 1H9]WNN89006.1 STAS domain-containing protein [Gloeocapsopsis dulcis]